MTTFVLVRHTESEYNAEDRLTGHHNPPLNDVGIQQAHALRDRLEAITGVTAIVSSDLLRAGQVAEILADARGLPVQMDSRFREVCIGALEGLTYPDAREKFPADRHHVRNPDFDFTDVGGESCAQALERHDSGLQFLREFHGPDAVIILVGHGLALRRVLETRGIAWDMPQGGYQILLM